MGARRWPSPAGGARRRACVEVSGVLTGPLRADPRPSTRSSWRWASRSRAGSAAGRPVAALAVVWVACALQLLRRCTDDAWSSSRSASWPSAARVGPPGRPWWSAGCRSRPRPWSWLLIVTARRRSASSATSRCSAELQDGAYRFSDTLAGRGDGPRRRWSWPVPWLAGLVLRFRDRAERSRGSQVERAEEAAARAQRETEQAREIARLREEQTRLARDVHDVVGHSLAVILAQAESAQYLPDDDPEALKQTMATIADLGPLLAAGRPPGALLDPDATTAPATRRPSTTCIDGVRASGHEVMATEVGHTASAAARARGGRLPGAPGDAHQRHQARPPRPARHVERHWPRGWTATCGSRCATSIERPTGATRPSRAGSGPPGQGLDGMRRRLESVGGHLDVRRREDDRRADVHRHRLGPGAGADDRARRRSGAARRRPGAVPRRRAGHRRRAGRHERRRLGRRRARGGPAGRRAASPTSS